MKEVKAKSVLIVDDHKIMRDGLEFILKDLSKSSSKYEFGHIAKVGNGKEALDLMKNEGFDIILLDINMPVMNGVEFMQKLNSEKISLKVLVLSMTSETQVVEQMIKLGVNGYLLKDCSKEELLMAINRIVDGGGYFSNRIMESMASLIRDQSSFSSSNNSLTNRELEVLKLVCNEYTNLEIADKLLISVRTVDVHKRNIIEKLKVKSMIGAAIHAINRRLVNFS